MLRRRRATPNRRRWSNSFPRRRRSPGLPCWRYVAQIDPGESPADLNEFLGHLLRSPIFAA
jgi:hypothetical protein